MCPLPTGKFCADTAVVEPAPFDNITITDVITNMTVEADSNAGQFGQRIDGAPVSTLALGIGEHPVGALVGYFGFLLSVVPSVPLACAHAICASLAGSDVRFISRDAAAAIVGRVLFTLAVQQGLCAFNASSRKMTLLPFSPLRTVRASFPAYGSSLL